MLGIPKDVLDDLCSRFLVNLPSNERDDNIRVCFQIEQSHKHPIIAFCITASVTAHWFYMDYYVVDEAMPECQSIGLRDFIRLMFHHCDFLQPSAHCVDSVIDLWREYKQSVPVYGCILLDESLQYVLLVQGYYAKNSWGFPKGKVNESEAPMRCACRETFEETGFDPSDLVDPASFMCYPVGDSLVQLYIAPGVSLEFPFKPCTRNEIKKIQWFRIDQLPTARSDGSKVSASGLTSKQLFTVLPFINYIKMYISGRRKTTAPPPLPHALRQGQQNNKVLSGGASAFKPPKHSTPQSATTSASTQAAKPSTSTAATGSSIPTGPPVGPVYSIESPVDFAGSSLSAKPGASSQQQPQQPSSQLHKSTSSASVNKSTKADKPPVVIGEIAPARAWQNVQINWKKVLATAR